LSNSYVKYKVISNGNSIEVYEYKSQRLLKQNVDVTTIEERKIATPLPSEQDLIQRIVTEDGEIEETRIRSKASLREKLEKGFIDKDQYSELKYESLKRSRVRALNNFRRTYDKNFESWGQKPKFLTLTYEGNMSDRVLALKDFSLFIRRFNYHLLRKEKKAKDRKKQVLKYMAVIEYQKRGAAHFHIVFFNLPFLEKKVVEDLWGHGFIKIEQIKKTGKGNPYRGMVFYLMKYMSKTLIEDIEASKSAGKLVADETIEKFYFSSRGLLKPQKMLLQATEKHHLDVLLKGMSVEYETTFNNEYTGEVTYKQYYKDTGVIPPL